MAYFPYNYDKCCNKTKHVIIRHNAPPTRHVSKRRRTINHRRDNPYYLYNMSGSSRQNTLKTHYLKIVHYHENVLVKDWVVRWWMHYAWMPFTYIVGCVYKKSATRSKPTGKGLLWELYNLYQSLMFTNTAHAKWQLKEGQGMDTHALHCERPSVVTSKVHHFPKCPFFKVEEFIFDFHLVIERCGVMFCIWQKQ